ncbi:MAG: sulfurtransferase [Proteobacteria bacterium]|jgi:rhodanese-related sulfurtransferase|nr:sulfurtransferase [Pseudomonadota bacterium]MCG6934669.1 sulfurtransferase [Pseudomonadota bacterium]
MLHYGPQELQEFLQHAASPPLLLDVREAWEFDICHLPGSVLMPMSQVPSRVEELDRSRPTVVICHHGIRSRHIALYLDHLAFNTVINLAGGVERWASELDPRMPRY